MTHWFRQLDGLFTTRNDIFLALLIGVGVGMLVQGMMWALINHILISKERLCGKCGYHLKHNPDQCPECGAWIKDVGLAFIHPKAWINTFTPKRCGIVAGVLASILLILWFTDSW